jgi:vacuolar-type H+-ATPase subunit I/STV1
VKNVKEVTEPVAKQKRHKKTSPRREIFGIVILVFLWAGLTYAGYWYATEYVERTVREIQETNALNVKMLEEEIQSLRTEMSAIEEALAQTDKTLSSTGSAGEAVNERISELDEQLNRLEKSLNILMERGNEDY